MSQVVTPPDIVKEDIVYLVVNAPVWDIEMVVRWLQINNKQYTIHLYHDGMDDPNWLHQAASESELIIVHRKQTANLEPILDFITRIRWVGEDQDYPSAAEYLVKNG